MTFVLADGRRRAVNPAADLTILEIAREFDLDIEGACEGCLACSTCHVIVDPDWADRLPEPSEDEEDMLDLAYGLTPTSRLGCQITVTDDLDGLVVSLPGETRNMLTAGD
jgi:2Fe-2S ferredoxin